MRISLDAPISTDMLCWLYEHDSTTWRVEPEYEMDDDGYETTDVYCDHIEFDNDQDATVFVLSCL